MKTVTGFFFGLIMLSPFRIFAQLPDNDGLILHFSARSPGQDFSGNGNNGTWNNISLSKGIPGISDSAFYFNGSDSYIEVKPSRSLDHCKSMTFTMWFNPDVLPTPISGFHLATRRFPSIHKFMCVILYPDGVVFGQTDGKTNIGLELAESVYMKKNAWYHVAGVFDRDKKEIKIYLNGTLRNTLPANIDLAAPECVPLNIGCDIRNDFVRERFFMGYIDDIRIYNRALGNEEVLHLTKGFVFPKPADAFEKTDHFAAGRYILSRMDSSGRIGTPPEVVEIIAVEPIWKQGWFVLCSIIGTFLLTFLLVHWYDRNLQQEQVFEFEKIRMLERERFRIAREMHDDIGSGLSAINLLTEIALNKSKEPQLAAEIERISAAARDVHARIQDIIWSISTQNDTLVSLLQHLQQFTNGLLATTGIVLHFGMPADIAAHTIPGDLRRALFLAYKEALNNIVRHAHATQVYISISIRGKQLCISICDNGRGFDPKGGTGNLGNGLFNMQRRMEEAGGGFQIRSGDRGTEIILNIQLG